jgi:hypothetical protein
MACDDQEDPAYDFLESGSVFPFGDEQHRAIG